MVSLKKIFKRYKYFFLLASLFVLGSATKSFALDIAIDNITKEWFCIIGETQCCVNGAKSCCEDNGTLYDTWSCNESCGASGTKEYKYTASGCSYSTSTRTCCSDGTWSPWDASCPTTKTCPTSSKPETRTTCTGGYKTRTVTCNTSTGTWTTGAWGDCDCSDSAYESVTLAGGGTCCQRKDGTGARCMTMGDLTIPYGWVEMGTPCWDKIDCGTGALPECNESMKGTYWSKWISDNTWNNGCGSLYPQTNGYGYCQQYLCRQG